MPCQPCGDGRWRWGASGDCVYESREECERANDGAHNATSRLPSRVCLYCRQPLPTRAISTGHDVEPTATVTCPCGITYSAELIREADDLRWDQAMRRDGFNIERDGDTLIVSTSRLTFERSR